MGDMKSTASDGKLPESKFFLYGLIITGASFWGVSFFATTIALRYMEPMQILAARWLIAMMIFLCLAFFKIIKVNFKKGHLKMLLVAGLFQPCLYSIFETNGINMTTTSESSIFIATVPIFVLIIGSIVLKTKPSKTIVFAILLAFIGLSFCMLFSPNFSVGGKIWGYIVLFGAILVGAGYTHISNEVQKNYTTMELTFTIAVMGGIFFNSINFLMGYGVATYIECFSNVTLLVAIVFLGALCSCFCYVAYNFAIVKLPTVIAANIVSNSTTTIGVLTGVLFAGDPFGWYTVVGLILTLVGICITTYEGNKIIT